MNDNYTHNEPDIIYVTGNIPGPKEDSIDYEVLMGEYNSLMLENCACKRMCISMRCSCLQTSHGDNYECFSLDGVLKFKFKVKPSIYRHCPILECNSNCPCSATCGNRLVQNGPLEGLIVKPCEEENKGLGLFTSNYIFKSAFICEYAGELLTRAQAIRRSEQNEAQGKMNYIFCLNEHTYDGLIQTFVDPSKFGNIGRYVNHSCDPNSFIVPVRSESTIPHLAIFACKHIMEGEEITIDYGRGGTDEAAPVDNPEVIRKPCFCKAPTCKGYLPFDNF